MPLTELGRKLAGLILADRSALAAEAKKEYKRLESAAVKDPSAKRLWRKALRRLAVAETRQDNVESVLIHNDAPDLTFTDPDGSVTYR